MALPTCVGPDDLCLLARNVRSLGWIGSSVSVIDVYADIWCPFTHVGLRLVADRRLTRGRREVAIRVRAWPLELVNGAPLDATRVESHGRELRDQVAPDMFRCFMPSAFPGTTLPALSLAESAYAASDAVGEAVSFELRDALFERGLDISDPHVLREIARAHQRDIPTEEDSAAVLADWHEGQRRGVRGSPHFFCNGRDVFCPSLDISHHDEHLRLSKDLPKLDRFLDACFETSRT
jgi:predicted DsbA family dithiol-disulfide isomerase